MLTSSLLNSSRNEFINALYYSQVKNEEKERKKLKKIPNLQIKKGGKLVMTLPE
jgi:hypothetical protein